MAFTINLPVDYHQQDKGTVQDGKYYCGPACAQMVLNQIGAGLLSQDNLYNDCHLNSIQDQGINPGWETGPDGLEWTMNQRKPATFRDQFRLITRRQEDSISRKIAWTIYHDKVAPIALVFGWSHWIVVRGFDSDVAPNRAGDRTYTIRAFWINDPAPPGSERMPPVPSSPHSRGDLCGSTGENYGKANGHIPYHRWRTEYMTGVPQGFWQNRFVAVCDPPASSEDDDDEQESEKPEKTEGEKNVNSMGEKSEKVISEKEAAYWALKALSDYELINQPFLKEILTDVQPSAPQLVQRLDKKNAFYYIVPLIGKDKKIRSLVSVDGHTGTYEQSSFAKGLKNPIIFHPLSENTLDELVRKELGLKKEKKITFSHYLVWMPCIESFSPHFPFHEVTIDDYKIYVRIDGKIFAKLTTDIPGA